MGRFYFVFYTKYNLKFIISFVQFQQIFFYTICSNIKY